MVSRKEQSSLPLNSIFQVKDKLHLDPNLSLPLVYSEALKRGFECLNNHTKHLASDLLAQSVGMADILISLQADPQTVLAALLYPYLYQGLISLESIQLTLGIEISQLLINLQRMNQIHSNLTQDLNEKQNQLDNFRKMMLAIIDDIRVVLIKLAEQTWLIRQAHEPHPHHKILAQDILTLYAPLANRLGIGQLKWELEDLAFRQLEPDQYKHIAKSLDTTRLGREAYVEELKAFLARALEEAGIKHCEIMGRAKHIYSIHNKMKRKRVDFSHIYDVIAIRVLTQTIEEAYATLAVVHSLWPPISEEFDDYIAKPKPNGYRSIHTAVLGPDHKNVEIQCRTFDMHQESELGVAAHWKYKEGGRSQESIFEQKIAWLRQVIEWQRDIVSREKGLLYADMQHLFDDRVYVFTPAGEVIDLPKGATPIDFAYAIHTQIGHRCRGAKINQHIVPLTHVLSTGECIEVLTAKEAHPRRDWLNTQLGYAVTERARNRIQQWFKQQDISQHIQTGRQQLDRELRQHHFPDFDLSKLVKKLKFKQADDLYLSLGRGETKMQHLLQVAHALFIAPPPHEIALSTTINEETHPSPSIGNTTTSIGGISGILTYPAKCCKPLPGDPVRGYISRNRGIIIHRVNCNNLTKCEGSDRLIAMAWEQDTQQRYPIDVVVIAHDQPDLIKDISGLFSAEKIKLLRLNVNHQGQLVKIYLGIEVSSRDILSRLMDKLQKIPGVKEVFRSTG